MLKAVIISDSGIMFAPCSCFCCAQTLVSFICPVYFFRSGSNSIYGSPWRITNFAGLQPGFQRISYFKA